MQSFKVYQSLWSLQDEANVPVASKEQALDRIAEAGYAGVSIDVAIDDFKESAAYRPLLEARGLECQVNLFARNDRDLDTLIRFGRDMDAKFCVVIGQVYPVNVAGAVPVVRRWLDIADAVGVPLLFETHRDSITNDMFFTLELLDAVPEMRLCADLSHYVLNRELQLPVNRTLADYIDRLLRRSESFQGRIATNQQIQVPPGLPQYAPWAELFKSFWRAGFEHWRRTHDDDASLVFLCELGPPLYALTDPNGRELSDRWEDSAMIAGWAKEVWAETARG